MAIQAFEVEYESGHSGGVVLVCSVTCLPLPLETCALRDLEDAEAFLAWAADRGFKDLRKLSPEALQDLGVCWGNVGRVAFERASV